MEQLQGDLNLQANQLLPLFNKGIRKFTKLFREVYEKDIEREMDQEKAKSNQAMAAMMIKAGGLKKSLEDELNEGETQLTKKLREEKEDFVKKFMGTKSHQIKAKDEDFEKALIGKKEGEHINVISVQKNSKRANEEEIEGLEE